MTPNLNNSLLFLGNPSKLSIHLSLNFHSPHQNGSHLDAPLQNRITFFASAAVVGESLRDVRIAVTKPGIGGCLAESHTKHPIIDV